MSRADALLPMRRSSRSPTCSGADHMRVALAGFGPFPGVPFNPSAVLVGELARRRRPAFADVVRTTHVFATSYAAVDRDLPRLFAEKPDLVLIFGVAGRRRYLSVETRARNALSVLHPDVSGHRPARGTIERGKPGALRGAAPFAQLLGAVRPSGFPALVAPLPDNRADFFLAGIGRARTIKSWQYRMNWIVN